MKMMTHLPYLKSIEIPTIFHRLLQICNCLTTVKHCQATDRPGRHHRTLSGDRPTWTSPSDTVGRQTDLDVTIGHCRATVRLNVTIGHCRATDRPGRHHRTLSGDRQIWTSPSDRVLCLMGIDIRRSSSLS